MEDLAKERSPSPRLLSKKHEGSSWRLIFAAFCAFLGSFSFGYSIGYSSPAIPSLEAGGMLSGEQSGWFGSLMTLGAIFGGPFSGWCIEKFGRKTTIKFTSVPFLVGWWCIINAAGNQGLFVGRYLCGFASGMITVCVPVYIAEISTSTLRGTLGAGVQLSITLGILAAYSAGLFFEWTIMGALGLIPPVLTFLLLCLVPETPRWLLMKGKKADAVAALRKIRHEHADCVDECRDIEEGLDTQEKFTWSEFKKPELARPLMISVIIMIFQQFSGINAVMFYTVSIFESAGLKNSKLATVVIGAVQVVATFVACILMDKMGRRRLLITAGSVMCVSCFIFGWYYHHTSGATGGKELGTLAVICLVVYIIGFSLGWGPIPMLIMSEIFPSRVRGAASGIAVFSNWFCAFIVTKEFPFIQETFGAATAFWLFAFCCMCSVMFVWKKVPETKGKSLEDIELYFLGKSMLYV